MTHYLSLQVLSVVEMKGKKSSPSYLQKSIRFQGRMYTIYHRGGYTTVPPSTMNLLVLNCRGLKNLRTGKELEVVIRTKDPSIVFLDETWADEARLKDIQRNINFENLFFVERNTRGGGLALHWKNSLDLHVESSSKNHIDSIINKGRDEAWRFTGLYGEPDTYRRSEAWNRLRLLNSSFQLP